MAFSLDVTQGFLKYDRQCGLNEMETQLHISPCQCHGPVTEDERELMQLPW